VTTLEILEAARALIAEPEHWTKHVRARNRWHEEVSPKSDDARQWCAVGAIERSCDIESRSRLFDLLRDGLPDRALVGDFNDSHTHAEVLDLFDRAIAAERAKAVAS